MSFAPNAYADALQIEGRAVRALLFDLGGVVVDLDFQRVFSRWALAARCDEADLTSRFTQDDAYCRHERGELDAAGYFSSLRTSLAIDLSDDQFLDGWNNLYLGPCDGIEPLLQRASRVYPLYAFTNSNTSHQSVWEPMLRRELTHFRKVFLSSELGLRKPEPEAFRRVADEAGFGLEEFLFFDDSEENVSGAQRLGMQGVLVRSVDDVRAALEMLGLFDHGAEPRP